MTVKKTVAVSGYCPYLDSQNTILATYAKYAPTGSSPAYANFLSHTCDYSGECTAEECPLVKLADSRVFW